MAINFGLTENGFVSPTFEEWLDDVEADLRSRFGEDIVLTSNSNFGILARMIAWRQAEMAQQLELVYYSGFYSTATDSALDRLGANVGITRKVATPSHATITVQTDGEYLVQADTQFETDDEYRKRLIMENAAKSGPTANGIKSALMNVAGVREVGIVDNSTGSTDSNGNPPYSVHIYVLGGAPADVAQALNDNVAAGVTLVGTQSVNVADDNGNVAAIHFDFATNKPIYVQVHLKTDDSWNGDSGVQDIQSAISDSINALEMGQTVLLTKLYPVIYGEDGVSEAQVTIGTSASALASNDITSQQFEVPVCDPNNVEVIIDG